MPPDRWFGIGSCAGTREQAGARAVDDALIHDDPKLLIVFCSQAHDLRQLLRQIHDRAGDVPLIGCTTAGEIATAGPSDASVVVTSIRSEIDRLAAMASGAPVAGFYTYGEIARTRGVRGFHNQTLVVLSIG